MKRIYWILVFIFTTLFATAQDNWKIKLNGKVLLSSQAENETVNSKRIKLTELSKKGTLDILYKESPPKSDWKRSLLFFDENDNELLRKDSITANTRVTTAAIKKLFAGKKKIRIYTISLPTDPNLAARIRVRRVHLCTLELQ